jgi:DNA polymerase V
MQTLDGVNKRYGRGTLKLASAGTQTQHRAWQMRQDRKTPGYTTDWDGLAEVRA